jgi:hypothetical protein
MFAGESVLWRIERCRDISDYFFQKAKLYASYGNTRSCRQTSQFARQRL